ncbi:MAG: DUF418 domain-containing protein [Flavisolibacter sp.]
MPSAPVLPQQRIHYLDVVRGIAISGVLLAYVFWNLGTAPESSFSAFDRLVDKTFVFLVDSKCYTLLANLFALGFVLHMNKPGDPETKLYTYRKRLLGLIIIGLLHALLLRNGDILVPYAVLSFLLTLFYRASNTTIALAMVFTFFLQILLPEAWAAMNWPIVQRPSAGNDPYLVDNFHWVRYWYTTAPFFWESTLFFLFSGLLLGRHFIEKKKKLSNSQLITVTVCGSFIGSVSYWVLASYSKELASLSDLGKTHIVRNTLTNTLGLLHRTGLASAYTCIAYACMRSFPLKIFEILGRTSLSNYILQSVIVVPLCLALNLFDHITPTIALIITAVVWIMQIIGSGVWLATYRFGPLEWLLRRFTYGNIISEIRQQEENQHRLIPLEPSDELPSIQ